jgi:mRNA-degrading endonuclease toxin of MazEF toxin-antitoxin module
VAVGKAPLSGQVVDHHFLWSEESDSGRVEGRKARPCLVVAVERTPAGASRVTVLPITSRKPSRESAAVTIPANVKAHMGLDRARDAWVIVDEANVFAWPGFDLVPQPDGGFVRGVVTRGFFQLVRRASLAQRSRGQLRPVARD